VPELSVDIDAYVDHLDGTGMDELVVDRRIADRVGALRRDGLRTRIVMSRRPRRQAARP
jgi:hypothetical protein